MPVYIHAAYRSPTGKFGGTLKPLNAPQLAAKTLNKAMQRSTFNKVDFVVMGHARQAGSGPNTSRQAAIGAGLCEKIPAWTLNHACASGMSAFIHGTEKILLGKATSVWVGGVESMSNTPYLLMKARWGQKLGNQKLIDAMYEDGFHCPMADMLMGETVERHIAQPQKISRLQQDQWALRSHQRAFKAWQKGEFKDEVLEFEEEAFSLTIDETLRADTTLESLAKLAPVFDEKGTLSAGNSSPLCDGSSWIYLSNNKEGALAEVIDYQLTALDPKLMGLGPVESIRALLANNQLKIQDIDVFEINEAFAAQVIACKNELKIEEEKLNPLGGAIALGHAIGSSGSRILSTLTHQIKNKKQWGVASLCVSGGQGFSVLLKSF